MKCSATYSSERSPGDVRGTGKGLPERQPTPLKQLVDVGKMKGHLYLSRPRRNSGHHTFALPNLARNESGTHHPFRCAEHKKTHTWPEGTSTAVSVPHQRVLSWARDEKRVGCTTSFNSGGMCSGGYGSACCNTTWSTRRTFNRALRELGRRS